MRFSRNSSRVGAAGDVLGPAAILLLFPALVSAVGSLDCSRVVVDKQSFNLKALGGPHSVMHSTPQPPSMLNATYTIDICSPLKRSGEHPGEECPAFTRVCAIERVINPIENTDTFFRSIPIAGELKDYHGGDLNAIPTRLRGSASHSDSEKEGLRIELHGGIYLKRKQKAIVEFLCDRDRTGLEHEQKPEDEYESEKKRKRDDEDGSQDGPDSPSLRFLSYGPDKADGDTDVLRLEWRTMYACEDTEVVNQGWGFFTWFILIGFLAIASYLIFGSWLNYNRYGARGWDLLPHGDTIRDIPYLLKDWARSVISTVQGGGSRGGYSAV